MQSAETAADAGPIAGRALTVREDVGPLGAYAPEAFDAQAMLQAIGERSVLVIDAVGVRVSGRHVKPVSGKGCLRVAGINEPITCGDLDARDQAFARAIDEGTEFGSVARSLDHL